MKNIYSKFSVIILFVMLTQTLIGQEVKLTNAYKKETIEKLSILLNDFYIYPDLAKKTSLHLGTQFEAGYFDPYKDYETFAKALTEEVQSVNSDKHMRIMVNNSYDAPDNTLESKAEMRMAQINNYRSYNQGFSALKLLEGNVAYLDLRGFAEMERGKEIADAYMKLMSQADAVIIDLSKNGGGSPQMVQYLCSYFFEHKLHLNSLFYREGEITEEYWTLEEVGGRKMADVPLFVVIGAETFSGAEEFSYNMQTQKRAVLIGQTSAGAANPGGTKMINNELAAFIPTGRAINPITNTSWENTGVVPDIITAKEETLEQVNTLAKNAAEDRRKKKLENYVRLHKDLNKHLDQYEKGTSEVNIRNSIAKLVSANLFGEWDVNTLGYEYLMNLNKPKIALCILESNTLLFPNSPNVFDSYGEALKMNGDLNASLVSYEKALELAIKNNDRNLEYYKEAVQNSKDLSK